MNYPQRDSQDSTDPPALLFRVTDRLRLDGCVAAMAQDAMSLALISLHEGTLDHYGKLLVDRLRAAAPEIALEIYFPASVEALLARFNDALRDYSIDDAMQGGVQNSAPRIWILHDAGALPDHEIELLARLIEHFPAANIRVLLLLTSNSNKHHLLNPFGHRILRWEIEPPTPEQAEAMLTQARSQGREGEALSLLHSAPALQAAKASAQTAAQTPPPSGASGKKHWRIASAVAALLLASTGAAFLLHSGIWTTAADLAANLAAVVAADVPAEPASASSGVATAVQSVVNEADAVEKVVADSAQGFSATAGLQQPPAEASSVQQITEPASPASAKYTFSMNLALGARGSEVSALQSVLREQGYFKGSVTGYFGPATKTALIRFQKAKGLAPYPGTLGSVTREVLNARQE